MKKIGFIDYFIDEWHANNYPAMIRASALAGKMDVALAWAQHDPLGKKPLEMWCKDHRVGRASSAQQVVDQCDYIIVLAPDNAETHEELADLPLRSGKPVYIDKPIAPTLAAAKRLFDKAAAHKTPMFSSSALRFGSAIEAAISGPFAGQAIDFLATRGGSVFQIYAVHQYEMIVAVYGTGARRVMQCGSDACPALTIDYGGGRFAHMSVVFGHPFQLTASWPATPHRGTHVIDKMDGFFPRFVEAVLRFFETGQPPVPAEQTLEIAALIEAGEAAVKRPFEWVPVPTA